jgi:hypothetical protein
LGEGSRTHALILLYPGALYPWFRTTKSRFALPFHTRHVSTENILSQLFGIRNHQGKLKGNSKRSIRILFPSNALFSIVLSRLRSLPLPLPPSPSFHSRNPEQTSKPQRDLIAPDSTFFEFLQLTEHYYCVIEVHDLQPPLPSP